MTTSVDFVGALEATVRIAAVGMGLTAMEHVADRRAFGPRGPFSASVVAAIRGAPTWALVGPTTVVAVATLQLIAAAFLIVLGPLPLIGQLALIAAVVTSMALRGRRILGGDGAERLTTIILIAATLAFIPITSPDRATLAVAFLAGQSSLAYVTAGAAKLVSPVWRGGSALPGILATYGHGHAWAATMLKAHPTVGKVLGWGVMLFEVLFPLLLLGPYAVALTAALVGVSFHIGCAVLMGLNSFPWAFPATYICLFAVRAYLLD
jgi:hypothetical protein